MLISCFHICYPLRLTNDVNVARPDAAPGGSNDHGIKYILGCFTGDR